MTSTAHRSVQSDLPPLDIKQGPFVPLKLGDPRFAAQAFNELFKEMNRLTFSERVAVTLLTCFITCLFFPFRLVMLLFQLLVDLLHNLLITHVWRTIGLIVLIVMAMNSYSTQGSLWVLDRRVAIWLNTP